MSEYFPGIEAIGYGGPDAEEELVFRRYDRDRLVEGRPMHEQLRFASAYWHTMRNPLADPFGVGTARMPWDDGSESVENAVERVGVFFEFLEKIDIDFFCFHDRDIAPEGDGVAESESNLERVIDAIEARMQASGKKLLWGTACLFTFASTRSGARGSGARIVLRALGRYALDFVEL